MLEKIWDLHDKLSDAIHSISRSHYLRTKSADVSLPRKSPTGFVFVKGFPETGDGGDGAEEYEVVVSEARSLNGIRAALENLEDQLEFFHTVQVQQRAERDAAIARLEQSRIFLARRLSEHHGKKYKVIEEALAFVEKSQFVSTNYTSILCPPGRSSVTRKGIRFNLFKVIVSSFSFIKRSLTHEMGGVLGNAALVALSMLALLHLHQTGSGNKHLLGLPAKKKSVYRSVDSSSSNHLAHLDVTLARG